jgi:menaquinone-9 beta-reductase
MSALHNLDSHYDAVIIGARCAGAATALLLARSGAKVLLVDRQAYGSDAISTHALMRGAVIQLNRWGLLPGVVAAGTPAIRTTTFYTPFLSHCSRESKKEHSCRRLIYEPSY